MCRSEQAWKYVDRCARERIEREAELGIGLNGEDVADIPDAERIGEEAEEDEDERRS